MHGHALSSPSSEAGTGLSDAGIRTPSTLSAAPAAAMGAAAGAAAGSVGQHPLSYAGSEIGSEIGGTQPVQPAQGHPSDTSLQGRPLSLTGSDIGSDTGALVPERIPGHTPLAAPQAQQRAQSLQGRPLSYAGSDIGSDIGGGPGTAHPTPPSLQPHALSQLGSDLGSSVPPAAGQDAAALTPHPLSYAGSDIGSDLGASVHANTAPLQAYGTPARGGPSPAPSSGSAAIPVGAAAASSVGAERPENPRMPTQSDAPGRSLQGSSYTPDRTSMQTHRVSFGGGPPGAPADSPGAVGPAGLLDSSQGFEGLQPCEEEGSPPSERAPSEAPSARGMQPNRSSWLSFAGSDFEGRERAGVRPSVDYSRPAPAPHRLSFAGSELSSYTRPPRAALQDDTQRPSIDEGPVQTAEGAIAAPAPHRLSFAGSEREAPPYTAGPAVPKSAQQPAQPAPPRPPLVSQPEHRPQPAPGRLSFGMALFGRSEPRQRTSTASLFGQSSKSEHVHHAPAGHRLSFAGSDLGSDVGAASTPTQTQPPAPGAMTAQGARPSTDIAPPQAERLSFAGPDFAAQARPATRPSTAALFEEPSQQQPQPAAGQVHAPAGHRLSLGGSDISAAQAQQLQARPSSERTGAPPGRLSFAAADLTTPPARAQRRDTAALFSAPPTTDQHPGPSGHRLSFAGSDLGSEISSAPAPAAPQASGSAAAQPSGPARSPPDRHAPAPHRLSFAAPDLVSTC